MKDQILIVRPNVSAEKHAKKAVLQIQNWVEKNYPKLAASVKSRMIIECLIELTEEKRLLTAQR